jgi:peptidoglycan/xylan/chitin deacetylase (PgdA/CDA1 family)
MAQFRIPILMYHCISKVAGRSRFNVSAEQFERQMKFLCDRGYHVVGLNTFLNALETETPLPTQSVVLTFDDGFQDTFDYACPILKQFGYPGTFFLVSRLIGKSNEWMGNTPPKNARLMGWREARQMLGEGHCLGSHTATHPILPDIEPSAVKLEVEQSKRELEDRLGVQIAFFAYPYGRFNPSTQEAVRLAGYLAACSTQAGFNGPDVDRFALRRLDVYGTSSMGMFRRNLIFGENQMTSARLAGYYARRAAAKFVNFRG